MAINLKPESTAAEVAQNVATIIATRRGTQPMDRMFGIDGEWLDDASPRGQALLAGTILDSVPQQESRVSVKRIRFEAEASVAVDGAIRPIVDYEIRI